MTVTQLITRGVPGVVRRPLAAPSALSSALSSVLSSVLPLALPRRVELALTAAVPAVLLVGVAAGDALQPAGYSPVRQTISVAAGHAGTDRWVANAALLAVGVGYLVIAAALLPRLGPCGRLGLLVTGICGLGVALFPEAASGPTSSHELWSVGGALALMLQPVFTYRRGAGRWFVAAGAGFAALTAWLVFELNLGDAAGLAERVTSTVEVCWPLALAVAFSRRPGRSTAPTRSARAGATPPRRY